MASAAPIRVSEMSEEEFERRTLDAIHREFGPGGVVRFLMAFRSGKGDYTRDRQQGLAGINQEDIARDMGIELPT